MTAPARPRAAVRIEARTVDMIRSLLDSDQAKAAFPHTVPELEALLPPVELFRSGMPPLFELCWHTPEGDFLTNCDRKAHHDGPHSWAIEPPF